MTTTKKRVTLVSPCFNEEANIETTLKKAVLVLPQVAKEWEILVIDDGSTDHTGTIVKKMAIIFFSKV